MPSNSSSMGRMPKFLPPPSGGPSRISLWPLPDSPAKAASAIQRTRTCTGYAWRRDWRRRNGWRGTGPNGTPVRQAVRQCGALRRGKREPDEPGAKEQGVSDDGMKIMNDNEW